MSEHQIKIAKRIRQRRKAAGFSREQLAKLLITDTDHIRALEDGVLEFKGREHALASLLMCHPRWLLTGEGTRELADL